LLPNFIFIDVFVLFINRSSPFLALMQWSVCRPFRGEAAKVAFKHLYAAVTSRRSRGTLPLKTFMQRSPRGEAAKTLLATFMQRYSRESRPLATPPPTENKYSIQNKGKCSIQNKRENTVFKIRGNKYFFSKGKSMVSRFSVRFLCVNIVKLV
jgi:hypothetical protein